MGISIIYKDIINGYIYISADGSNIITSNGVYYFQIPKPKLESTYYTGDEIKDIKCTSFNKTGSEISLTYTYNNSEYSTPIKETKLNQLNLNDIIDINSTIKLNFTSFTVNTSFNCFVYGDNPSNGSTSSTYLLYYHDPTNSSTNTTNTIGFGIGIGTAQQTDPSINDLNQFDEEKQIAEQNLEKINQNQNNTTKLDGQYSIDININKFNTKSSFYAYINIIELGDKFIFGKMENNNIDVSFSIRKYVEPVGSVSAVSTDQLSLTDLIAMPLDSIIKTNSDLNIKQFNDNLSMYFNQTKQDFFEMRSAYFSYNTNTDETIGDPSITKLPLITLLDYNRLNVNDAKVEFTIDATKSTTDQSYSFAYSNNQSIGSGIGSVSGSASGSVSSVSNTFTSQIKMTINIKKDDEPPGLSKLKSLLTDKIKFG